MNEIEFRNIRKSLQILDRYLRISKICYYLETSINKRPHSKNKYAYPILKFLSLTLTDLIVGVLAGTPHSSVVEFNSFINHHCEQQP